MELAGGIVVLWTRQMVCDCDDGYDYASASVEEARQSAVDACGFTTEDGQKRSFLPRQARRKA